MNNKARDCNRISIREGHCLLFTSRRKEGACATKERFTIDGLRVLWTKIYGPFFLSEVILLLIADRIDRSASMCFVEGSERERDISDRVCGIHCRLFQAPRCRASCLLMKTVL